MGAMMFWKKIKPAARAGMEESAGWFATGIVRLKNAGADLILLAFLHFQEEVEYFGKHVIPLVRELEEAASAQAVAAE